MVSQYQNSGVTDWAKIFADRLRRQRAMIGSGSAFSSLRPGADDGGAGGSATGKNLPPNAGGSGSTAPVMGMAKIGPLSNSALSGSLTASGASASIGPASAANTATGQSAALTPMQQLANAINGTSGTQSSGADAGAVATTGLSEESTGDPGAIPRPVEDNTYGFNSGLEPTGMTPQKDWYASLPDISAKKLATEPGRWATRYAIENGYGMGVERLLNQFGSDPNAAYTLSLGALGGEDVDPFNKLNFAGGVYDDEFDFDRSTGGGYSPSDVINAVMGASGGPEGSYLGQILYGGQNEGAWVNQVEDTITFLESALRGRVSDEVLGPLLEMYLREGDMFLAWKDQNPTGAGNFGQWILDRLGENGGL